MPVVSQAGNNVADRGLRNVAHPLNARGRKRAHEPQWDDENTGRAQCGSFKDSGGYQGKKQKVSAGPLQPVRDASNARAPGASDSAGGGWIYDPHLLAIKDLSTKVSEEEKAKKSARLDKEVNKVVSLVLEALSPCASQEDSSPSSAKCSSQSRRVPTSPLSGAKERAPLVRKIVGGRLSGRTELSLARQVMSQNLLIDIRSVPYSCRSSDWMSDFHEMGWEELHFDYYAQCNTTSHDLFGDFDEYQELEEFSVEEPHDGWDGSGPIPLSNSRTVLVHEYQIR